MPFDRTEINEVLDEPILSLEEMSSVVEEGMQDPEVATCMEIWDRWGSSIIYNDLFRIGSRLDYITGLVKKMREGNWVDNDVDGLEVAFDWCLQYEMKEEAERVGEVAVLMDVYDVPRVVALCRIHQEVF